MYQFWAIRFHGPRQDVAISRDYKHKDVCIKRAMERMKKIKKHAAPGMYQVHVIDKNKQDKRSGIYNSLWAETCVIKGSVPATKDVLYINGAKMGENKPSKHAIWFRNVSTKDFKRWDVMRHSHLVGRLEFYDHAEPEEWGVFDPFANTPDGIVETGTFKECKAFARKHFSKDAKFKVATEKDFY